MRCFELRWQRISDVYCLAVQHGDVLRVGIATAGNDHRLGAQEAPPAIISLYTGEMMEQHLKVFIRYCCSPCLALPCWLLSFLILLCVRARVCVVRVRAW